MASLFYKKLDGSIVSKFVRRKQNMAHEIAYNAVSALNSLRNRGIIVQLFHFVTNHQQFRSAVPELGRKPETSDCESITLVIVLTEQAGT